MKDETIQTQPSVATQPGQVELDTPIKRGADAITHVQLRKPKSGELRGLNLSNLANLDVSSLIKLIPRISQPALVEQEVANLDPADLTALGVEVATFLAPKKLQQDYQ